MTKTRISMFAALAVIVALGLFGQPALAADFQLHSMIIAKADLPAGMVSPDAASQLHQLVTAMGAGSPDTSSDVPYWPCFTGGSDPACSSIPAGGIVLGAPFYTWPLTTCTSSTEACGTIYWLFETDVASTKAEIDVTVTVTQGSNTIYTVGGAVGKNPGAGNVEIVYANAAFGEGDCFNGGTCVNPSAGVATITTTTTIGKQSATGKATITLSASD